jgi:hypothetical protein
MPTKEEINSFSRGLRDTAERRHVTLWEAVCMHCDTTGMEPEVAASLLTKDVLADLTVEAQDLNLLRVRGRKAGRLPI